MALTIKVLDERTRSVWDRFVADCPSASFYHRAGWGRAIERAFGQRAHYLYAERDGQMVGILPLIHMKSPIFGNRLVSTAFSVGGGVAALDDDVHEALDAHAIKLMASVGADYLEYRQPDRLHGGQPGWVAVTGLHANFERPNVIGDDAAMKWVPSVRRREVKRAMENGLVAETDMHPDRFYRVYAQTMRDLGTPVFGSKFFRMLMAEFGSDCECMMIRRDDTCLSAAMSFYFRDRVILHFLGNLPEAKASFATGLLLWRLSQRARARGYDVFDYGRSKVGTGNAFFKEKWGFAARPLASEFWMSAGQPVPEINPTNPAYARMIDLWKRLPLAVANTIGPRIIRHIG